MSETPVRKVAAGHPTDGMVREEAIVLDDVWRGALSTAARATSCTSRRTVHRESNPTAEPAEVVLVRRGSGPVVVNVDGPAGQQG